MLWGNKIAMIRGHNAYIQTRKLFVQLIGFSLQCKGALAQSRLPSAQRNSTFQSERTEIDHTEVYSRDQDRKVMMLIVASVSVASIICIVMIIIFRCKKVSIHEDAVGPVQETNLQPDLRLNDLPPRRGEVDVDIVLGNTVHRHLNLVPSFLRRHCLAQSTGRFEGTIESRLNACQMCFERPRSVLFLPCRCVQKEEQEGFEVDNRELLF